VAWPIPPARYGPLALLDSFDSAFRSPLGGSFPLSPAGEPDVNRLEAAFRRERGKQQAREQKAADW